MIFVCCETAETMFKDKAATCHKSRQGNLNVSKIKSVKTQNKVCTICLHLTSSIIFSDNFVKKKKNNKTVVYDVWSIMSDLTWDKVWGALVKISTNKREVILHLHIHEQNELRYKSMIIIVGQLCLK